MFDTKIAIVVRDDLAMWQKLNVTAFLTSGLVAQSPEIIGEAYKDAEGHVYNAMTVQPMVVLSADQNTMRSIHKRSIDRSVKTSAYIEQMFETGHDAANRTAFAQYSPDNANLVGLALRAQKKIVDMIVKGATMHP